MFILDENQQHHLLVILNEINRYIYESSILLQQQQNQVNKNNNSSNKNVQKNQRKTPLELPATITGFNFSNRQRLIDYVQNATAYFKTFFKYTMTNSDQQDFNQKSRIILICLSIFYDKMLFQNIDFDQIFTEESSLSLSSSSASSYDKNKDLCAKSKVILNGTVDNNLLEKVKELNTVAANQQNATIHVDELVSRMNVLHELHLPASNQIYQQTLSNLNNELNNNNNNNNNSAQLSQFQPLNVSQLSNLDPKISSKENEIFSIEQQNTLNYQTIKDITFVSILITVIFYKLRYLFPNLAARCEEAWKFLLTFERELDASFLHESFLDFLQSELFQQKQANRKRVDSLKQEIVFLEKVSKMMEKEVETEIHRLLQLKNKTNKIPPLLNAVNRVPQYQPQQQQQSTNIASNLTNHQATVTLPIDANQKSNNNPNVKGTRPCPECGKLFKNTYKLNRHLYVHKDPSEKPFVCSWDNCNYRSISKNDLNRHKMIHTGEKPFLCEIEGCEKRYSRADKLRHHKLSVHFKDSTKREQICIWPGCNFQCLSKNELNRHQLTHEAIKCEFVGCEKIFDKVEKLKRHREKDHLKLEVNLAEFSTGQPPQPSNTSNFSAVPISVTSTPDIATVAAGSANHQQQIQMQHVMLANDQNMNSIAIQQHHHMVVDDGKITDLSSHHISPSSLTNVVATSEANPHNHHHQQQQQQLNHNQAVANNNVISTISSVPISVVASNSSNHRQNPISVWSS